MSAFNESVLLSGGPSLQVASLPDQPSRLIKLYLAATATDSTAERNALVERVNPKLREYCRHKYGLEFQVLDLRWGNREEWNDISLDRQLALDSITECQQKSIGPNFVAFVGQKYGPVPVPYMIPATEFDLIRTTLRQHRNRETRDVALLEVWYRLDSNAEPPVYVLLDQRSGAHAQLRYQAKVSLIKDGPVEPFVWEETRASLQRLLRKGLEYCVLEGTVTDMEANNYTMADLETEIQLGALQTDRPEDSSLVFVRNIVDLKNYITHPTVKDYLVTCYNDRDQKWLVDSVSEERLRQLRERLQQGLVPGDSLQDFEVLWKHDDGIHPSSHQDYLDKLCNTYQEKITGLIDRLAQSQNDKQQSPLVAEVLQHWNIVKAKTKVFIGRSDILEIIGRYVVSNDRKPLVMHGSSGSGKTATIAMAAARTQQWLDGADVVTVVRFIGTTAASFDIRQLLRSICTQIVTAIGDKPNVVPNGFNELQTFFFQLLDHFPDNKNLVIYLDSLHMLVPQYDAYLMQWMPHLLKENVKVIVSVLPGTQDIMDRLLTDVVQQQGNFVEIAPMDISESLDLLHILLRQDGRTISAEQESVVTEIFKQCSFPLYVHLMYTYARHWRSDAQVDSSMFPSSIRDYIHGLFDYLEQKYGQQVVSKSLAYLTASTTGISCCELEDLMSLDDEVLDEVFAQQPQPPVRRIPPLAWARLYNEIKDFILEKECEGLSLMYWNHRLFTEAAKERYLADGPQRQQIHSLLAEYHMGVWHGVPKAYKRPSSSNNNEEEETADRHVPSQPLTFVGAEGEVHFNKRKYEQVPQHLFLSGRLTELNDTVLFSYEWLYNKTKALSLEHVLSDFLLNPGVEATLVEKALRDAQTFIGDDINTMAAEITGRLLSYYTTHTNIQRLIDQCDSTGLKHCALTPSFPYSQVPGSPLKFSLDSPTQPSQLGIVGENGRFLVANDPLKPVVYQFDLATGESLTPIQASSGEMQLSPNGKYLVMVDHMYRRSVKIHSSANGQYVGQLIPMNQMQVKPREKYKLQNIAVSDYHVCMIVTVEKSYLCIADIETCAFKQIIGLDGRCNLCAITPDSRFVFCNADKKLLSYDLYSLQQKTASSLDYIPSSVCFNSDVSKGFLLNKQENKVYVLVIGNGNVEFIYKVVVSEPFEKDQALAIAMSNKEDMILVRGKDNLLVYHIDSEKVIAHITRPVDVPKEFKLPRSSYVDIVFTQACFSPDDKFVIASIFRNVYIWNVANNRLLTTLQAPVGIIGELLVPSDRGQVVTYQQGSKTVNVWSLGDAIASVGMLDSLTTAVEEIKLAQDDSTAFVRCAGSDEIGILDMATGQLADLMTHESPVIDFTSTQDGNYMAVSVKDGKEGMVNKIWHIPDRKIIYEFGDVPAHAVALQNESTIVCVTKDSTDYNSPYHISQFKFHGGTFDEYRFDNEINFVLTKPFVTPEDKYLVILSADSYDNKNALHVNPTICAISLQSSVSMSTFSAKELAEHIQMRRILHIRPYANNSYTIIVLFTNEPDLDDDGRGSRVYDHCYNFMIFDVCSGVVCQVIENFMAPSTPIEQVLFTNDVRYCLDHMSNLFDMGTGYFIKCLHEDEPRPHRLALKGKVALYFTESMFYAIRIEDCKMLGCLNTHGQISTIEVCHDERTIVIGCKDGSLKSYVLIDDDVENSKEFLKKMPSRLLPEPQTIVQKPVSARGRSWDKVSLENGLIAPPYSRPPSAALLGPSDTELLKKVKPVSRTRPMSDTALYVPSNTSRACSLM